MNNAQKLVKILENYVKLNMEEQTSIDVQKISLLKEVIMKEEMELVVLVYGGNISRMKILL